jgi:hypothetical protein
MREKQSRGHPDAADLFGVLLRQIVVGQRRDDPRDDILAPLRSAMSDALDTSRAVNSAGRSRM